MVSTRFRNTKENKWWQSVVSDLVSIQYHFFFDVASFTLENFFSMSKPPRTKSLVFTLPDRAVLSTFTVGRHLLTMVWALLDRIAKATVDVLKMCLRHKRPVSLESPKTSYLWRLESMVQVHPNIVYAVRLVTLILRAATSLCETRFFRFMQPLSP